MGIIFLYLFSIKGTELESEPGSISDFTDILRKKNITLESRTPLKKENYDSLTLRRSKRSFCLEDMWTQKRRENDLANRDWTRSEQVSHSLRSNPVNEPRKGKSQISGCKLNIHDEERFDIRAYLKEREDRNESIKAELQVQAHGLLCKSNMSKIPSPVKKIPAKHDKLFTKIQSRCGRQRNSLQRSSIPVAGPQKSIKNKVARKSLKSEQKNISKERKNIDSLISFGNKSQEHIHLETFELPKKINENKLTYKKIMASAENLYSKLNLSRTHLQPSQTEEDGDRDHTILNTEELISKILKSIEKASEKYYSLLKIIDETPSDDQYEQLMKLNAHFDKINVFRDELLGRIEIVLRDINISSGKAGVLEKFKLEAENQLYNMNREITKLDIFSDTLRKNMPIKENYSRDFEILIRIFEYLYALVFIEEYRINNEQLIPERDTEQITEADKVFKFEDIPFPYLKDIFTHDVGQFFISNDNKAEKYWAVIRNFVNELEKYAKILLFESQCSISDFFKEISRIFNEISDDPENKYRNIVGRIAQSKILKAVYEEVMLIKASDIEKAEVHSEIEFMLLETIDCYLLIE